MINTRVVSEYKKNAWIRPYPVPCQSLWFGDGDYDLIDSVGTKYLTGKELNTLLL